MNPTISVSLDPSEAPRYWADRRAFALVLAREDGKTTGAVALLDPDDPESDRGIVAVPDAPADLLVPLMRAAARHGGDVGATELRWTVDTGHIPCSVLAELGAFPGRLVRRWWQLELPAVRNLTHRTLLAHRLSTHDGPTLTMEFRGATYSARVDGDTATLTHHRDDPGTVSGLLALLSTTLITLRCGHPALRHVETTTAPDDDRHIAALVGLGFTPATRQTVEYHLPLGPNR
ncbi:hypothetical protein [Amycolatopsis anabasis]|uniref:hypothetical protein n=1 Tax=Amycolatopsis anabasis TaxID=1840409 RepID=UPI00131C3568|nr:hypothetical protein [Amycolatopsis anabasis]